jgi:hypothetical protein
MRRVSVSDFGRSFFVEKRIASLVTAGRVRKPENTDFVYKNYPKMNHTEYKNLERKGKCIRKTNFIDHSIISLALKYRTKYKSRNQNPLSN